MSEAIFYSYYHGNLAARRDITVQNLYQRFNYRYIYIYNNSDLSNEGRENNLLFILDTVKYKILVINKTGFTEELDLFNKVSKFTIDYVGPRQVNYIFFKIKALYNSYKFKFTFNNNNNKSYLHFKNTAQRTKKEREYKTYTTYYIIKNELVIPPPAYTQSLTSNTLTQNNTSSKTTNTTNENKKSYIQTTSV